MPCRSRAGIRLRPNGSAACGHAVVPAPKNRWRNRHVFRAILGIVASRSENCKTAQQSLSEPISNFVSAVYYKLGATTLQQLERKGIITGPIPENLKKKKPDGLITLDDGTVKACVEYKTPIELNTPAKIKNVIEKKADVAKTLCSVLIVSDGSRTFWINPYTKNHIQVSQSHNTLPVFNAEMIIGGTAALEYLQRIEQVIDSADHFLSPTNDKLDDMMPIDPSQLARTLWQKIWINTGKEPVKCLYNVAELLIFKFLSDLSVLGEHNNFVTVLDFEVMLISAPFSISSAPSSSCTFLSQHPRPT